MRRTLSLCVVPAVVAGCAFDPVIAPADVIALDGAVSDEAQLTGVTRDPTTGRLHVLLTGQGIVELDERGGVSERYDVGARGLLDLPYRDVASLGDGRFLLIADNEGYLYDAVTEQHRVHFCVRPGFVECFDENGELIDENGNGICDWEEEPAPNPRDPTTPLEPVVVQKNDALALVGGEVVAAPRFYEQGTRVEASLRSYDVDDGAPTGAVDISGLDLELFGIAPVAGGLVGVAGDRLVRFTSGGELVERAVLDGVQDAAGVIADGDDAVLVLDAAANALIRFELP